MATLLDAAAAVFAEAGYDGATTTEIAARAGAAIGSLYQFFPTKEQLAAELHARQLDAMDGMLEALVAACVGASPEAVTDRLFTGLVGFLEAHPAFVVLGERRSLDPAAKKRARARLRGRIDRLLGVAEPPVAPCRRAALAAVTLHLIRAAAMLKADDDATVRDAAVAELRAMLRAHLAAAAAPGAAAPG